MATFRTRVVRPSYSRAIQWMVDTHMAHRAGYTREWLVDMLSTMLSVEVTAHAFHVRKATVVRDVMALWTKQGAR